MLVSCVIDAVFDWSDGYIDCQLIMEANHFIYIGMLMCSLYEVTRLLLTAVENQFL